MLKNYSFNKFHIFIVTFVKQLKPKDMQKNPNCWRLMAMFFTMALLFAMGTIQGNEVPALRQVQTELMNSPPGQTMIIIAVENNRLVVNELLVSYQIARGVSVPYRGLITNNAINSYILQDFKCYLYYTISPTEKQPRLLAGFRTEIDKYPFTACDLGNRKRVNTYI